MIQFSKAKMSYYEHDHRIFLFNAAAQAANYFISQRKENNT